MPDGRVGLCGATMPDVHTDDEPRRLRDLVAGRSSPFGLFSTPPRVTAAQCFLALLGA
ncbi:MAG: hypothetical protein NVS3B26_17310 [Mycobacteriales bacterium]